MANHLPFEKLGYWQQIAFASAILERMLPNYQMFSENSQFGDYALLRNQLDLVWQWLDKNSQIKININAQLAKLEAQTPDPEAFDTFGVFPALDVCMAMVSLLQLIQSNGKDKNYDDVNNISRLSDNSVSYYVELLLLDEEVEVNTKTISEDPLAVWEKETQNELFDFIKFAIQNRMK